MFRPAFRVKLKSGTSRAFHDYVINTRLACTSVVRVMHDIVVITKIQQSRPEIAASV